MAPKIMWVWQIIYESCRNYFSLLLSHVYEFFMIINDVSNAAGRATRIRHKKIRNKGTTILWTSPTQFLAHWWMNVNHLYEFASLTLLASSLNIQFQHSNHIWEAKDKVRTCKAERVWRHKRVNKNASNTWCPELL